MLLSQIILRNLIIALANKEAGTELFNAINNGLAVSDKTLHILVDAMANEPAAEGLANAIANHETISNRVLRVLVVALANKASAEQIDEKLIENAALPPLVFTSHDFLLTCEACIDAYNADIEANGQDTGAFAACNAAAEATANSVAPGHSASCTSTVETPGTWTCGCTTVECVPPNVDCQN